MNEFVLTQLTTFGVKVVNKIYVQFCERTWCFRRHNEIRVSICLEEGLATKLFDTERIANLHRMVRERHVKEGEDPTQAPAGVIFAMTHVRISVVDHTPDKSHETEHHQDRVKRHGDDRNDASEGFVRQKHGKNDAPAGQDEENSIDQRKNGAVFDFGEYRRNEEHCEGE